MNSVFISFSRRCALCMSVALLASACSVLPAVGTDYQAPELRLPAQWSSAAAAPAVPLSTQPLADWWRQLGDSTLDELIEQALAGNLDLKLTQARLRQARAARTQAASAYFPSLSASAGASRSKASRAVSALPQRTLYDSGFDASWEIDLFGGTRRAVEAADADLAASAADADNTRVSLLAELVQNYIDLRSYQQRLAIARDNLASQSETLQITSWREQAGLANGSDVEQARTSREQTRASIPDLEVALAAAENRLAVLLGRSPGALHAQLATVRPLPDVAAGVAAGIPADVLRQRPDLIAAERSLAAETARVGQKLAQRFPSLSLAGSFGWQAYSSAALGGSDTLLRSLSGTLAATLFDGGRLRSAVEIQSAVQEQALITYENSVLGALEEVENALVAHAQARERIAARRAAAQSARNAAELSRRMYEAGLADFQKVLETGRTRLSAEDGLAQAEATQLASLIKLYKALGGGWQSPAVRAAVTEEPA
ncbi:efflux transporter outer membrane subunit [Rhodocyclus tenuis]|uniref:efflux transporter outer membrane subunit n=1 Tax=Rhodocyclus tenuis TaxID=1066 RepID=UPI0019047564|nr:efflux transporter outer membrane subunit [Rhodocyclus tenuis]MBK1681105.1 RND transporter [Rhodocyclus tenuis]